MAHTLPTLGNLAICHVTAEKNDNSQFTHFSKRFYFNGQLMCLTAADKPGYWGQEAPSRTFELWSTWCTITAEGDGMRDVPQLEGEELLICGSPVGNFIIRPKTEQDKVNRIPSYAGYVAEPIIHINE